MQAILDRWRGLPGSLKEKVFKNDNLRKDVGNFFNLVESMRESPTFGQKRPATASMLPSGMLRLVNPLDGTAYKVGAAGLTKILFNPKGARALMEGLAIQGKTAGRTLAVAEVLKIAGDDVQKIEPGDEPQGVR